MGATFFYIQQPIASALGICVFLQSLRLAYPTLRLRCRLGWYGESRPRGEENKKYFCEFASSRRCAGDFSVKNTAEKHRKDKFPRYRLPKEKIRTARMKFVDGENRAINQLW